MTTKTPSSVTLLKAGALIEPDESTDSQKLPTRRQLAKVATKFDDLPTYEVLRRLYKRHSTGIWQSVWVVTILLIVTAQF